MKKTALLIIVLLFPVLTFAQEYKTVVLNEGLALKSFDVFRRSMFTPDPVEAMIDHIWSKMTSERTLPDKNTEILKNLYTYAMMNPSRFYQGESGQGQFVPQGGYKGYWNSNNPDWTFIGFSKAAFDELTGSYRLTFKDAALTNDWFDLNGSGQGYQKQVCIGTKKVNLYCIKRTAFEKALGYDVEAESTDGVDQGKEK